MVGRAEIRALFERAQRSGVQLRTTADGRGHSCAATIGGVVDEYLYLESQDLELGPRLQVALTFDLEGCEYLFAARPRGDGSLAVLMPSAVYELERRDARRRRVTEDEGERRAECRSKSGEVVAGVVADASQGGLGIVVPQAGAAKLGDSFTVRYTNAVGQLGDLQGTVRNECPDPARNGWVRLGLRVSTVPSLGRVPIDERQSVLEGDLATPLWRPAASRAERAEEVRHRLNVVWYPNAAGRPLCGLVDRAGGGTGARAVVIPPAWGKTKETLSGLAQTLVQTFSAAGERLVVLRFDGSNRVGESYRVPANRAPGREYLGFTFSEAVDDIVASLDFLERDSRFQCRDFVLVTHSLGSIEGRRAASVDPRIVGWVSVAGLPDLQSGLRSVSGGIDYAAGIERGTIFGLQELVGVQADMDRTGRDALGAHLVSAEDARRDMARISVPVVWIHGRHDGWIERSRIEDLLSAGDPSRRKLIVIPAGHHMRTSRSAFDTFRLVAEEVSQIHVGRRLRSSIDRAAVTAASQAEEARLAPRSVDLRAFWRDYLMGRDARLGIELLSNTSSYQLLMHDQIARLRLEPSLRIADLGCGLGDFVVAAGSSGQLPADLRIVGIDLVRDALARAKARTLGVQSTQPLDVVCADLSAANCIPLGSNSVDRVLASLLISYLPRPEKFLLEVYRVLKPGGVLVLSSLRRDPDISMIYRGGSDELVPDRVQSLFGGRVAASFDVLQREFLNEVARLVDLEEAGYFRFWDPVELAACIRGAGFVQVSAEPALGQPPQAVLITAAKP